MSETMPAIFPGHGNPMNAILKNDFTEAWRALGAAIPRPKTILSVSAHWYVPGTAVTTGTSPETIHDFGGFPKELYEFTYRAPGDPALGTRVRELLAPTPVRLDKRWGLDHGTWSVLCHLFPDASIPVVQLSIDETQPPAFHFELAKKLGALRDEGVLILGSGNVVHNLHAYAWGRRSFEPYDWAKRFDKKVRELLAAGDDGALVAYDDLGSDAELSIPTPDHFLPLLYVTALRRRGERLSFPVEGMDGGSVSMLGVRIG